MPRNLGEKAEDTGDACSNHDLHVPSSRRCSKMIPVGSDGTHVYSLADRIKEILGDDAGDKGLTCPGPVFSSMGEFSPNAANAWMQKARWVRFEERVEESGGRFSKPHVGSLSLHALFELRSYLLNGGLFLNVAASSKSDVFESVVDQMVAYGYLDKEFRDQVEETLHKPHVHAFEARTRHGSGETSQATTCKLPFGRSPSSGDSQENDGDDLDAKGNKRFRKRVPATAEACNILLAETEYLPKVAACFARLNEPAMMTGMTEVPVPTRFLFILMGGPGHLAKFHEVGRALGNLMSDEIFREVAYKASRRDHILSGVDEFLDAVTVLPPGEWDPKIRIDPPLVVPSQASRKCGTHTLELKEVTDEEKIQNLREKSGLVLTGRFCGGLINDIKRKLPWYISDYRDAFSMQVISTWLFLYFGCLTPIVTFGGLLGNATGQRLAVLESLMSGMVCGVSWGLFSGQPLTIIGSTGPVLVFESVLYDFCTDQGWDYLSFRLCIGLWVGFFMLFVVAFDLSSFVCYITRFTEEAFASLIGLIFIYEAFMQLYKISKKFPVLPPSDRRCVCLPPGSTRVNAMASEINSTASLANGTSFNVTSYFTTTAPVTSGFTGPWSELSTTNCTALGGELSPACTYEPNVLLMSIILLVFTYMLSMSLKNFKEAPFFSFRVRKFLSDFAVTIAVTIMTTIDYLVGVATPKLLVPDNFAPTWSGRGWVIPLFNGNAWWTALAAIPPAVLLTVLVFMDQQITAVISNRPENKLRKGCGYHLDLLVLTGLIVTCAFLGLPFFVAATVLTINHIKSLSLETDTVAPGEKPRFLGVLEQRVTQLLIFLTVGMSAFLVQVLKLIPMPALFGVFLYMGVSALKGLQFYHRILLMFMPVKYQPDAPYLRKVSIGRVHVFTIVQVSCLAFLWLIKMVRQTKISFPIMLLVSVGVRKLLERFYTKRELQVLDDLVPPLKRYRRGDRKSGTRGATCCDGADETDGALLPKQSGENVSDSSKLPSNGPTKQLSSSDINLSDEVEKCTAWTAANVSTNVYMRHPNNKQSKNQSSSVGIPLRREEHDVCDDNGNDMKDRLLSENSV